MPQADKDRRRDRTGSALIFALILIVVLTALSMGMLTMSGVNLQVAQNQRHANTALASAASGLEVMRYWLGRISIPEDTPEEEIVRATSTALTDELAYYDATNILVSCNGPLLRVRPVTLQESTDQRFAARLRRLSDDALQLDVTGYAGDSSMTIRSTFWLSRGPSAVFGYGVATRGPLHLQGNAAMLARHDPRDADVYIESPNQHLSLEVHGNMRFDGDVEIVNSHGNLFCRGSVAIGGDRGRAAIDQHVRTGVGRLILPRPDTEHFRQYATGPVIDATTDTTGEMVLTNATIAAGTHPSFEGSVRINGVLFIETPNMVEFRSGVGVKGFIIGDGDTDNPGQNGLTFRGDLNCRPLPTDSAYDAMRREKSIAVLAPGFALRLQGELEYLSGVMAVSGLSIGGPLDTKVRATIINYSSEPAVLGGSPTLLFDRRGVAPTPGGFAAVLTPTYDPTSYEEIRGLDIAAERTTVSGSDETGDETTDRNGGRDTTSSSRRVRHILRDRWSK